MEWNLKKSKSFSKPEGPVVVVVLDGVGVGPKNDGNAFYHADTPTLDRLLLQEPNRLLKAHGTAVGLPSDKDMGNSEVGHNALGSGRIFSQGAKLVNSAIETGALFESDLWRSMMEQCGKGGAFHFIGLLSDGNVHSHIDHLFATIKRAQKEGVKTVYVHTLLDGRDVGEKSALKYIDSLESFLRPFDEKDGLRYKIASGGGRMKVTMDRYEADWAVVKKGWKAHVLGQGRPFSSSKEAIDTYRKEDPSITDQFLDSFVVEEKGSPVGTVEDGDVVLFFNFRGDRAIEISRAFDEPHFQKFQRHRYPDVLYAGMLRYDGDLGIPKNFLLPPPNLTRTMGQYLSENGYRQVACAETQKFGHVTYFWNGNRSGKFDEKLETYIEIPSDRIPFEQRPWMKAAEATDAFIKALKEEKPHFARINYANGDMVGHTGVFKSARMAMEAVDLCLAKLLEEIKNMKGRALITADHGNVDEMFMLDKKTGQVIKNSEGKTTPKTSHTLNPVFLILYTPNTEDFFLDTSTKEAGIANIAATSLDLMGLEPPQDYLPSLLKKK